MFSTLKDNTENTTLLSTLPSNYRKNKTNGYNQMQKLAADTQNLNTVQVDK